MQSTLWHCGYRSIWVLAIFWIVISVRPVAALDFRWYAGALVYLAM